MSKEDIESFFGETWKELKEAIGNALYTDIKLLDTTNKTLLANSGKMLRPVVSLLVSRMCAGSSEISSDGLKCAAAVELLHNATLLHDDVADDSDQRRGKPTVKKVLGDRASVLAGDFWLVRSMELILSCDNHREVFTRMFAKTLNDLAEGELFQLEKTRSCDTSEEDYMRIIYSKTASLFECACLSAAISQGADETLQDSAREYGKAIGLAFQIKDDIMDYESDSSIGKPVGVDLQEKKITLPLLGALLKASGEKERTIREMVAGIDKHPEYLDRIREFVKYEKGADYAKERLMEFVQKAQNSLKSFPDVEERKLLYEVTQYIADREI